jgi:hypothetical protein
LGMVDSSAPSVMVHIVLKCMFPACKNLYNLAPFLTNPYVFDTWNAFDNWNEK